jgi:hypothetical protein
MTPGSGSMKAPGIDSPCMMPGSPTANPMISSGIGHHSPSNPAMMPGGAPDIAGSPVMNPNSSGPQPTLTGDSINRMDCISYSSNSRITHVSPWSSCQLCTCSVTSRQFMESKGLMPQEPPGNPVLTIPSFLSKIHLNTNHLSTS